MFDMDANRMCTNKYDMKINDSIMHDNNYKKYEGQFRNELFCRVDKETQESAVFKNTHKSTISFLRFLKKNNFV